MNDGEQGKLVPAGLMYTEQHEWIRIEGNTGVVGITDHAQHALSDITYVELPKPGRAVAKGKEVCVVESCKMAADVFAPMSGKVLEANGDLDKDPSLVNSDPYGRGWLFKLELSQPGEKSGLMTAEQYAGMAAGGGH